VRYRHPKAEVHANGIWGGVGTRPDPDPWTPGGKVKQAKKEWVPRALQRLRLRRTRARRSSSGDGSAWPAFLVFGIVVIPLVYLVGAFLIGMFESIF